jgi:hypothetical protein
MTIADLGILTSGGALAQAVNKIQELKINLKKSII